MTPKLVTFDCAGTLVEVPPGWSIGKFIVDCANHVGEAASESDAAVYNRLYMARIGEFVALNMARDSQAQKAFWKSLGIQWLEETGRSTDQIAPMLAAADDLGFGANSIVFKLFEDVPAALDDLDRLGIKLGVVSNWDYSLHRVLRMFGLYDRFITVKASLEEGVEKPDPRLFEIALRDAGFSAEETVHVGDDLTDDIEGAAAAGIRAIRIDRLAADPQPPTISTLADLPEVLAWIA